MDERKYFVLKKSIFMLKLLFSFTFIPGIGIGPVEITPQFLKKTVSTVSIEIQETKNSNYSRKGKENVLSTSSCL